MIKIIVIIFFAAGLLLAPWPGHGEEKTLPGSSPVPAIRPKIEYITEAEKEPFLDYFTKNKPKLEVTAKAEVTAAAVVKEELKPRPALPALTVQGIIWGGSAPCAIINNEVVRQGDSIQEVKLIKIEKESIEVLYQGWNYSLSPPAGLSSGKNPEGGEDE